MTSCDNHKSLLSLVKNPSTILLLDGGTSTNLEQILQSKPEPQNFPDRNLWSSSLLLSTSGQRHIQESHEKFYDAGSDIVTTVTYQLSHYACRYGYDADMIDDMLIKAVVIARKAAASKATTIPHRYVVASLGCFGAVLADGSEYTGEYGNSKSIEELIDFHKERIQVFLHKSTSDGLRAANVDGVAFETIPCVQEVKAVVQMMKSLQSGVFTWLSLACKDENTLNDGTSIVDVMDIINQIDPNGDTIQGIGVNCCKVKLIRDLARMIANHMIASKCRRAVVLYPNSGEEWEAENETWVKGSGCTADDFTNEIMGSIREIHESCDEREIPRFSILVGGCCRTSPLMIASLRTAVDKYTCDTKRKGV